MKKEQIIGSKERNTISLILSAFILVIISAVAYAYFTAQITNNSTNQVTIRTKNMRLAFADGEDASINEKIDLGGSIEKKFTIENTGDMDTYAKLMWKDMTNTFEYRDMKYTLSYAEDTDNDGDIEEETYTNLTYNENIPTSSTPITAPLKGGIYIPVNKKYYFKLKVDLVYSEVWAQPITENTRFNTKFELVSDYESESTETLLAMGLGVQNKISNSGNYDTLATTDETANGLFSMEDDYGTSYYFRGAVENNYVKFGKYSSTAYYGYKTAGNTNDFMVYKDQASCTAGINGTYNVNCTAATALAGKPMYWRIIRINGDGSLRMIYDGTQAHANGTNNAERLALKNKPWNLTNYGDAKFVGYMYGGENTNNSSTSYNATIGSSGYAVATNAVYNQTDTNMKTMLTNWYRQNLKDNYDSYLSDEIFCNDRTISENGRNWWNDDTMRGWRNGVTRFAGFLSHYTELSNTYNNQSHSPYLKCDQKNDSFTVGGSGNGKLGEKVGLITVDEANIAGGRYGRPDGSSKNNQFYLYKGTLYWSFSPHGMTSKGYANMLYVVAAGHLSSANVAGVASGVAPVINLSAANARQLTGDGTVEHPFELSES